MGRRMQKNDKEGEDGNALPPPGRSLHSSWKDNNTTSPRSSCFHSLVDTTHRRKRKTRASAAKRWPPRRGPTPLPPHCHHTARTGLHSHDLAPWSGWENKDTEKMAVLSHTHERGTAFDARLVPNTIVVLAFYASSSMVGGLPSALGGP